MIANEQLSDFEAAVIAFRLRFEQQLLSRWEHLEGKTGPAVMNATPDGKGQLLLAFFKDAEKEIAAIIHEYFPTLLKVATMHRARLVDRSPLAWTQVQIFTQVSNFLGVDETFDEKSVPRDDSRVLRTIERICTGRGWFDDGCPVEFRLPSWSKRKRGLSQHMNLQPMHLSESSNSCSENDTEPLSRSDTLKWVKETEFWIWRKVEHQIEDEWWEGIIEAGKTGVSVLQKASDDTRTAGNIVTQETPQPNLPDTEGGRTTSDANAFVRQGEVWSISYEGKSCLVPHQLGLEYIARLLQNPGRPMSALAVQRGADANPDAGVVVAVREMEVSDGRLYQERSDAKAMQQYKAEAERLADEMADAKQRGNQRKYEELLERLELIREHVKVDTGRGGRRRRFSDDVEKARTSVTKAINRAIRSIRQQDNAIADHLQTNIATGAELVYRDASTPWNASLA
ncbi:MAG: hypothetical protein WA655_07760 [Candidatus Korobacteraceae bacterium]